MEHSKGGRTPDREGIIPHIIAIANQKGGVGKTTTAINLATSLAGAQQRVLLIDLDPQGNASTGLGIEYGTMRAGSYALLAENTPLSSLTRETMVPGLFLLPADTELAGAEIELVTYDRREFLLRQALRDAAAPLAYDFILIDCPPSLGLLTLNALCAADGVLVPLQCEFFALEGVSHLVRTIDRVRRAFNAQLQLQGLVLTMFDRRNNLSELVASDARGFFGNQVFETVIPRNIRISEAQSYGKPALHYDPRSSGSIAYAKLAEELVQRIAHTASRKPRP